VRAYYLKACTFLEDLPRTGVIQDRPIRSERRKPLAAQALDRPGSGLAAVVLAGGV